MRASSNLTAPPGLALTNTKSPPIVPPNSPVILNPCWAKLTTNEQTTSNIDNTIFFMTFSFLINPSRFDRQVSTGELTTCL